MGNRGYVGACVVSIGRTRSTFDPHSLVPTAGVEHSGETGPGGRSKLPRAATPIPS
jgi:hypothetical protein